MRLGCIHDTPDRRAAHTHELFGVAPLPAVLDRPAWPVGLYRNDVLNDCVIAALANSLRTTSWLRTGADRATTDDAVIASFAEAAGVALDAVGGVPGLMPLDVLEAIQAGGFEAGGPAPESFRSISTFATRDGICEAVMRYGSAMLAIDLFDGDMDGEWTSPPAGGLDGGHMVLARRWTLDGPVLATWGGERQASWQWLMTRMVCGYAVDWVIETP
jgi:hypothetical protein